MKRWLIYGNSKKFDHIRCLRETHQCYWYMQNSHFEVDDIVYIFISSLKKVMFETKVVEVDVSDCNPQRYQFKGYEKRLHCIRLELVSEYQDCLLNEEFLKQHGYKDSSLQKHNWKNEALLDYISSCFKSSYYKQSNYSEGRLRTALLSIYERSSDARRCFLEQQQKPYKCCVCDMDFESIYGEKGKDFIHVHHLDPLSSDTGERNTEFDDLAMVCPNCHAMLHRGDKLLHPEELRKEIQNKKLT